MKFSVAMQQELANWKFEKRAPRFLLEDYESTIEQLLSKEGRSSMSINRLRTLGVEICSF